mgnify:FL=1
MCVAMVRVETLIVDYIFTFSLSKSFDVLSYNDITVFCFVFTCCFRSCIAFCLIFVSHCSQSTIIMYCL